MAVEVVSDEAIFIEGAIEEVRLSLLLSVVIVIAVVGLFLGRWRSTLIPAVAIPVSLIGTLAAIWLLGYSLNLLTLLALVLASGLVVDDTSVVLENIMRRRAEGLGRRAAAVLGTREVFFAIMATTATLAAVFIPISFLPSLTGRLFAEFGFVMAIAVALFGPRLEPIEVWLGPCRREVVAMDAAYEEAHFVPEYARAGHAL